MNIRAVANFRPGNLARIQEQVTAHTLSATTRGGQVVLNAALQYCPVKTGALQQSGHLVVTLQGQQVTASIIFDEPYAAFVEFGTGIRGAASAGAGPYPYSPTWPGMAAQPYVRPALYNNQDAILGEFRQGYGST